jgi:hypothetical protein
MNKYHNIALTLLSMDSVSLGTRVVLIQGDLKGKINTSIKPEILRGYNHGIKDCDRNVGTVL